MMRFLIFQYILIVLDVVLCFNLETRIPIVKYGQQGSYFGYSVASHQSKKENAKDIQDSWLLVGAPLGMNLQPKTNRSGALWKCPITTRQDDCIQVVTDGKRTIEAKDLQPPLDDEIKEGQWLGVTVQSQGIGGKAMVCAHRYATKGDGHVEGQGLCYTFTQQLEFEESWEPCKGESSSNSYEYYGFCQAGTSAILLEDDTALFGAPGSMSWKGNIFTLSVSDDYMNRSKVKYKAPIFDNSFPVDKYSYLGMSVVAGHFFDFHDLTLAAGAPRGNGTGQVIFFSRSQNPMEVKLVIQGESFASSFGYEITAADVNGDGKSDLIVGAPFYFSKDAGGAAYIYMNSHKDFDSTSSRFDSPPLRLFGKPESRFGFALACIGDLNKDNFEDIAVGAPYENNGAIYIYLGSKNGLIVEPSQVIKADALSVPGIDTLGYSLSGRLDLDENGYPDLLVGAYNSDAVLLFRARPIVGLKTTIEPDVNLRDIDPNKKGCPEDQNSLLPCFTFRTCCTIESSPNQILTLKYRLEAETFSSYRKFSRVCFDPYGPEKPHTVEKKIEVSSGNANHKVCQNHTAYIKNSTDDIQSPIKFKVTYSLEQHEPKPINPGEPVPSLDEFPILNQQEAAKVFEATFLKDCGNNDICESQLRVKSVLLLPFLDYSDDSIYELMLGTVEELLINITVSNLNESAYEAQLFVVHSPSLNYIGRSKQEGKQLNCNPYNKTLVTCSLGNPMTKNASMNVQLRFDPKGLSDSETTLDFVVFTNSTSQEKERQEPLNLRASVTKRAELSLKGLARPEQVFFGGQHQTDSTIKYLDDIGSRVIHTYQVFNAGPWRVQNVEIHIEWPHKLTSQKEKCLLYIQEKPHIEALSGGECFMLPGQVNPKGLGHRPGMTESSLDAISHLPSYSRFESAIPKVPAQVTMHNTSKVAPYDRAMNRIRRAFDNIPTPEVYVNKEGKQKNVVNLNCLLGTASCIKFKCIVYSLQPNQEATVFIKARLWNSSLIEDFRNTDLIRIASRAKIHLPPSPVIHQNITDDVAQVETLAKVDLLEQTQEPIPLWILIIAIIAGLLLLILLTYCLHKLGFFKRRRPDPTLSGNIEKRRVDDSIYDY